MKKMGLVLLAACTIAVPASAQMKIKGTETCPKPDTMQSVDVTDAVASDCERHIGTLKAGEAKSYTCTKGPVDKTFSTTAAATATGSSGKTTDRTTVEVKLKR